MGRIYFEEVNTPAISINDIVHDHYHLRINWSYSEQSVAIYRTGNA